MWRAGRTTESGFTLLEVLIVLTVLSLAGTATVLGVGNARDRIMFVRAGAWLDSTLSSLRGQARREGRMTWVDFDLAARRYRLPEGQWLGLPSGVTWEMTPEPDPSADIRTVAFLPDGTASGAALTIRAGGYASVHRVDWLTGSIRHAHH